ncbi:MAG: hypothetical protein R2825_16945 [Saprospiraceae bacterium]
MALILSHYEGECQLTSGCRGEFFKAQRIACIQNEEEAARWADIKKTFVKTRSF